MPKDSGGRGSETKKLETPLDASYRRNPSGVSLLRLNVVHGNLIHWYRFIPSCYRALTACVA